MRTILWLAPVHRRRGSRPRSRSAARVFEFEFESTVTRWQGESAWHFIALPPELAEDIRRFRGDLAGGWGSIKVDVRVGETEWCTSISRTGRVRATC